jgi:NAD(P)-dependent dehydrogenase (short-subunit alcohol dehydrogenase family)
VLTGSGATFFLGTLSGRVAIVTGSTSGIGLGIARSFLGAGANVMLNGFGDAKEVEATRAGLEKEFPGAKVAYSPADMASAEQIKKMVEDTVSKLGSLDILVNKSDTAEKRLELLIRWRRNFSSHSGYSLCDRPAPAFSMSLHLPPSLPLSGIASSASISPPLSTPSRAPSRTC